MGFFELAAIAVGLSMDAFAVAMCKGVARKRVSSLDMVIAGSYFGLFQAMMPLIGYLLGSSFSKYIVSFDHWIAFGLLCILGANMIRGAFSEEADGDASSSMDAKTMLVMAVATSIDALAVGITFAFLKVSIIPAVLFIGCTTFVISCIGMYLGGKLGKIKGFNAELCGGAVLILIGSKILFEHLGIF